MRNRATIGHLESHCDIGWSRIRWCGRVRTMGTRNRASRRILAAGAIVFGVPLAVVTCQGRGTVLDETDTDSITVESGGSGSQVTTRHTSSGEASSTSLATGEGTADQMGSGGTLSAVPLAPEAGGTWGAMGSGGSKPMTTTSAGGASAVWGRGGSTSTSSGLGDGAAGAGRVFLGKYVEPPQSLGNFWVPTPPATATVTVPCAERREVCAGVQSRDIWVRNVVTDCMAETNSGGCVDFIFERGTSCAKYVVNWHGATRDMGRCVATVDYYESCSGPDVGEHNSVVRYGTDCSPL